METLLHRIATVRAFARRRWFGLTWGALIVLLLALLSIGIGDDWRHLHDDDGMHYSIIAYSHLQGVAETGLHNAYRDPLSGEIVGRYLHHPPLLGLAIAAAFKVTGMTDYWVPRVLTVLFHLIVLGCTTYLAWRLFDQRREVVLLVAAGFALVPVSTYFGKAVVYPPITMAFGMLGVVAHFNAMERLRWRQRGWWQFALLSVPVWLLAAFSGWFSNFLLAAVGLHALAAATQARGRMRWQAAGLTAGYALLGVLGIALVGLHMYAVGGVDAFGDFISVYRARSGMQELEVMGSDYTAYATKAVTWSMLRFLAVVPALLTLLWLALSIRRAVRGGLTYADVWIFTLLVPGQLYIVAASRGATQHPFYVYFIMPAVVLASIRMVLEGWSRYRGWASHRQRWARYATGLALGVSMVTATVVLWQQYRTDDPFALDRVATLQIRLLVPPGQRMFPPRVIRPRLPAFESNDGSIFPSSWGIPPEDEAEVVRAPRPPRHRA